MNIVEAFLFMVFNMLGIAVSQNAGSVVQVGIYNFFSIRGAFSEEKAVSLGLVDYVAMGLTYPDNEKKMLAVQNSLLRYGVRMVGDKYWLDLALYEANVKSTHERSARILKIMVILVAVLVVWAIVYGIVFGVDMFN